VHQVGRGVILRAAHPTPQVQPVDLCSDREGGVRCPELVRPVVHCGVIDLVPGARLRRVALDLQVLLDPRLGRHRMGEPDDDGLPHTDTAVGTAAGAGARFAAACAVGVIVVITPVVDPVTPAGFWVTASCAP